jgi:protein-S-isoprenylcysteine O-methyltransferase Ste14
MMRSIMRLVKAAGYFAATVIMYLGLPLLGWGIGDVGGFLSSPPRVAYAGLIVSVSVVAAYASFRAPEGLRGGRGLRSKRVSRQTVVARAMTLLLLVGLTLVPCFDRRGILVIPIGAAGRWIGFALGATGLLTIFWSGIALGRQYSPEVTVQEGHRLITRGAYRYIRHPRYLGGIIMGIGLSALFRSWVGLVLAAIFAGVVLFRIADEERLMAQEFTEEWDRYCARSWRLIPFVY